MLTREMNDNSIEMMYHHVVHEGENKYWNMYNEAFAMEKGCASQGTHTLGKNHLESTSPWKGNSLEKGVMEK